MMTALLSWLLMLVYLSTIWLIGLFYRFSVDALRGRAALLSLSEIAIYLLLALSGLLPVSLVMYEQWFIEQSSALRFAVSLLLINGLLFYVGVSYMESLQDEAHKTYSKSAEFKRFSRRSFNGEAAFHYLLVRAPSVYFFILTFTLIPTMLEPRASDGLRSFFGENIVLSMFLTVSRTADGLMSPLFWTQLAAFVAVRSFDSTGLD